MKSKTSAGSKKHRDSKDSDVSTNSKNSTDSINSLVEEYRDRKWRRTPELRIETASQVEQLIEDIGFCYALTDIRTDLPSVYISVCGGATPICQKMFRKIRKQAFPGF